MSDSVVRSFCYEQPFSIGGHVKRTILNMAGPLSYLTAAKDIIAATIFGGGPNAKFIGVKVGMTNSGTYLIRARHLVEGPTLTVTMIWYVVATGAEVANATNLSAERYRMEADFIQ